MPIKINSMLKSINVSSQDKIKIVLEIQNKPLGDELAALRKSLGEMVAIAVPSQEDDLVEGGDANG